MRISDWSSYVCSSDLAGVEIFDSLAVEAPALHMLLGADRRIAVIAPVMRPRRAAFPQFAALQQQPEHRVRRHDPSLDLLAAPDDHHLAPHHRAFIGDRLPPAPPARQRARPGPLDSGNTPPRTVHRLAATPHATGCLPPIPKQPRS